MIYLIKTSTLIIKDVTNENVDEVIPVLKIGYSDDFRGEGRFKDYISNGLSIRIMKKIPGGSVNLEHTLQRHFQIHRLPDKSLEWFYYNEEIIDFFNSCNDIVDIYNLFGVSNEDELIKKQFDSKSSLCKFRHELNDGFSRLLNDCPNNMIVISTFNNIINSTTLPEKMKALCTCNLNEENMNLLLNYLPQNFADIYITLGPDRLRALGYNFTKISREYSTKLFNVNILREHVYRSFNIGEKYTKKDIKRIFSNIFSEIGYNKTPMANLIFEFFKVEEKLLTLPGKKRAAGYLIVSKIYDV